ARGRCGVLLDGDGPLVEPVLRAHPSGLDVVVLSAGAAALPALVTAVRETGAQVFAVATSVAQARQAAAASGDAVIAKGNGAGGGVGAESTFIPLQRCLAELRLPVWAQGGIGPHTAAACYAAGATGVVLDSQLLLARESRLPSTWRSRILAADGSETVCLGSLGNEAGARVRILPQVP